MLRLVRHWLDRRAQARAQTQRDAGQLMTFLGDMAYAEARSRARACRGRGDRAGDRHWSRVAVIVAQRAGYVIGLKTADRYDQRSSEDDHTLVAVRRAARATTPILELLREAAMGRITPTSLHNIEATVWSAVGTARQDGAVRIAGDEVRRAAAALVAHAGGMTADIASRVYPLALTTAGEAVERLRDALARAHLSAPGIAVQCSR